MSPPHNHLLNLADVRGHHGGDERLFGDVAALLMAHDACHRFGLSLLYRRLALQPQELLIEEAIPCLRRLVVRPGTSAAGARPVSWRFDPDGGPAICTGLAMLPALEPVDLPFDDGAWA